jgi:hypothetical protein
MSETPNGSVTTSPTISSADPVISAIYEAIEVWKSDPVEKNSGYVSTLIKRIRAIGSDT